MNTGWGQLNTQDVPRTAFPNILPQTSLINSGTIFQLALWLLIYCDCNTINSSTDNNEAGGAGCIVVGYSTSVVTGYVMRAR